MPPRDAKCWCIFVETIIIYVSSLSGRWGTQMDHPTRSLCGPDKLHEKAETDRIIRAVLIHRVHLSIGNTIGFQTHRHCHAAPHRKHPPGGGGQQVAQNVNFWGLHAILTRSPLPLTSHDGGRHSQLRLLPCASPSFLPLYIASGLDSSPSPHTPLPPRSGL